MRMIEAIINPTQLDAVKAELAKYGLLGVTAVECKSLDASFDHRYRGMVAHMNISPRILLKLAVKDYEADPAVHAIRTAARTGQESDGDIFVFALSEATRIRTGERDDQAL